MGGGKAGRRGGIWWGRRGGGGRGGGLAPAVREGSSGLYPSANREKESV